MSTTSFSLGRSKAQHCGSAGARASDVNALVCLHQAYSRLPLPSASSAGDHGVCHRCTALQKCYYRIFIFA